MEDCHSSKSLRLFFWFFGCAQFPRIPLFPLLRRQFLVRIGTRKLSSRESTHHSTRVSSGISRRAVEMTDHHQSMVYLDNCEERCTQPLKLVKKQLHRSQAERILSTNSNSQLDLMENQIQQTLNAILAKRSSHFEQIGNIVAAQRGMFKTWHGSVIGRNTHNPANADLVYRASEPDVGVPCSIRQYGL